MLIFKVCGRSTEIPGWVSYTDARYTLAWSVVARQHASFGFICVYRYKKRTYLVQCKAPQGASKRRGRVRSRTGVIHATMPLNHSWAKDPALLSRLAKRLGGRQEGQATRQATKKMDL